MLNLPLISFAFAAIALAQGSLLAIDQQNAAVTELKGHLENELNTSYTREDYRLGNWLTKHNFDVQNTLDSIRKHLQFRSENNLDQILDENWDDLRVRFPYTRNTFDKTGKPLLYQDLNQWDIASYLSSSEPSSYERLVRYMMMMHEESEEHVRQLRAIGRDVSQYNHIINAGGFSISKHGCIQCAYFARDMANSLTSYTPVNIEKTVLVNVPYLYKVIHSTLADEAQNSLKLYGQDQTQWENMLLSYIERDQFPLGILEELQTKDNTEGVITWSQEL